LGKEHFAVAFSGSFALLGLIKREAMGAPSVST
jgi:hypothetical protein